MYLILTRLLHPFMLLMVAVAIVEAVLWYRRPDWRRTLRWLIVPSILLYAFCTPAVSYLALGSLEWRYPPLEVRSDEVQAIVVLSGGIQPPDEIRRQAVLGVDTVYRCMYAVDLYRQGPSRPVVLSGGKVDPGQPGPTLAEAMRDFLLRLGVAPEDIVLESGSRSTYENAALTADLLRQRDVSHIALVTDATHMLRSQRCFQRQQLLVTPAPCRHRATSFQWSLFSFLPSPSAASSNQAVFHEYVGLLWYWMHDRI